MIENFQVLKIGISSLGSSNFRYLKGSYCSHFLTINAIKLNHICLTLNFVQLPFDNATELGYNWQHIA